MVFENLLYQSSVALNAKYYYEHKLQIILAKLTRRRYTFRWMCGIALILIYPIIRFQNLTDSSYAFRFISIWSTVSRRRSNVSAVSTGPNVPLVTVDLYYLPSNEPKMTRHRAPKEHAYGTVDNGSDYPIGAQLRSNPSEYTIPADRSSYRTSYPVFKYFHEMAEHYHIDARFGKPNHAIFSSAKRAVILRGLFTAWSNFIDEKQIPSWIAHGTLLGWWWGGSFLPWDTDIDVQMNANFLYVLARFNNTVLSGRYLIDVNPHFRARHPQSYNVIDARLIDKHTGYFVDITGMADTGSRKSSDSQQLLLRDKHIHKTFYLDLHPLVRIEFEGIATWRPYHVEHCLIREYGPQALRQTAYRGYNYNVINATWIRNRPLLANRSHAFPGWKSTARVGPIRARSDRIPDG